MKIVAVSQRVDQFPERNEIRDALDQRLISFLMHANCLPIPVPNVLHLGESTGAKIKDQVGVNAWLKVVAPQAILLSGGNEIGQFQSRDFIEDRLLAYAQELRLPVLGICRGMQMIAHWAGTALRPVLGHVKTRHKLIGENVSEVNSFHGWALTKCPDDFEVIAYSEDGEIEAIRHQTMPWQGWMWHPEREKEFTELDIKRLKDLFRCNDSKNGECN